MTSTPQETIFQSIGDGAIPLILHVPHNATQLPDDFEWHLSRELLKRDMFRLVDHHTLELFQPLITAGGVALHNNFCRLYFDPERFADREQESMNQLGMGVFYTHSTDGQRFRETDSDALYQQRIQDLHQPYHQKLTTLVEEILQRFGKVLIIDCHSYPKEVLPFEQYPNDPRPQIDIGTWEPPYPHSRRELVTHTRQSFEKSDYSVELNAPFKGSLVPTQYIGDPRVQSIMLEIRRDVYLCEEAYAQAEIQLDIKKVVRFHQVLEQWLSTIHQYW